MTHHEMNQVDQLVHIDMLADQAGTKEEIDKRLDEFMALWSKMSTAQRLEFFRQQGRRLNMPDPEAWAHSGLSWLAIYDEIAPRGDLVEHDVKYFE